MENIEGKFQGSKTNQGVPYPKNYQASYNWKEHFGRARSVYIANPGEIKVFNRSTFKAVLEDYTRKYLQRTPYYRGSSQRILFRTKDSDEEFCQCKEHKMEVKLGPKLIGFAKSLDRELVVEKAALEGLRFICPELALRMSGTVSLEDSSEEQFETKPCPEPSQTTPAQLLQYITSERPPEAKPVKKVKINPFFENKKEFCTFLETKRKEMLQTNFKEKTKTKTAPEVFSNMLQNYLKFAVKFFFKVHEGKDEVTPFINKNNELPFVLVADGPVRLDEADDSIETFALMACNFDRFSGKAEEELQTELAKEAVSFIALARGKSKQEAKRHATQSFLDFVFGETPKTVDEKEIVAMELKRKVRKQQEEYENAAIAGDAEYFLLQVTNPKIAFCGDQFIGTSVSHKNPKALLAELVSKKYKTTIDNFVSIKKETIDVGFNKVVLEYRGIKTEESAKNVKVAENLAVQKLLKLMYPGTLYYYELLAMIVGVKGENIPDPVFGQEKEIREDEFLKKIVLESQKRYLDLRTSAWTD